ncbi:uncharacterized protein LOC127719489 [Mytilus californianus]|uniref:uncharacterized protein LOC127719489 n=1 Tax=Mytilus californianus TaxID=6549 RepID=UPI0022483664|nr:uncharacterized protein LOC127719489 [Mytilus californianus]
MAENKTFTEEETWTHSCKQQETENAENYELENKGGNRKKNSDHNNYENCDEDGDKACDDEENECDEDEENDCDWMTKEEEERKIIQCLKDVVVRCTHANPKKRPTSYEVLDMLYKVYEPPKEPWSVRNFCQYACQAENYEDYEDSTMDTPAQDK